MKKIIFIIFIISFGFTSCITQKKCNKRFPPQIITKDSIVYKTNTVYRDTILYVYLPADTVYDTTNVPVYIDTETGLINSDTNEIGNRYATALAWVNNSTLKQLLIQNEQTINFSIDSAIRVTKQEYENYHSETIIKEVQYTAWYDIGSRILASLFLLVILIYVVIKFAGVYFKTIKPF